MTAAVARGRDVGVELWVAIVGAIGGAITVIVGAWKAIARARVAGSVRREQTALDALLADADRMRDAVFARLDRTETKMQSLEAQLAAAREVNHELRGRIAELEGGLATSERLRQMAERRAEALAAELHQLRREIGK